MGRGAIEMRSKTRVPKVSDRTKILGSPGSGKTYAIKEKFKDLLRNGYKPDQITVITFRRSSAHDLQQAIKPYVKKIYEKLEHVGTIHSICYRLSGQDYVLRKENYKEFARDYGYEPYLKSPTLAGVDDEESIYSGNIFDMYTWLRNTCTSFEDWELYPGAENIELPSHLVPKFFHDYEKFKKENNVIDFSDMLQRIIDNHILLDTPVLIVDEFQDLTAQMYKIFEMWASNCEIVVIAGDPFQSIYGFWGGSPDYFNNWSASEEIVLPRTYRLPEQIVKFSRQILELQDMTPPNPQAKTGYIDPIQIIRYNDPQPSFETELHLVRSRFQMASVALMLAEAGKPFTDSEAKKLKKGEESNHRRGFGWTEDEVHLANSIIKWRTGKEHLRTPDECRILMKAYPAKMCKMGFENSPLIDAVLSNDPTRNMIRQDRLFVAKMEGILDRQSVITEDDVNSVRLMTIHGSKGLQANGVFLHTYIPPRVFNAILSSDDEAAAEARVWFVGATRAIDALYLVEDEGRNYEMPEVPIC